MQKKKNIVEALTEAGQNWHNPEFFVSPNERIPQSLENFEVTPNYYMLGICTEGEMEGSVNTDKIKFTPFNLFAASPESGSIKINRINNCVVRTIFFTRDFLFKNESLGKTFDDFTFYNNSLFTHISLSEDEALPFIQLYELLSSKKDSFSSPYHAEIIRTLILSFFYEAQVVTAKQNELTKQKSNKKDKLSNQFKELVNNQSSIQLNLKFYADNLFVSPKYLIEVIKEKNGKTPKAIIIEARIEDAKKYLQYSNLTVSEISDQLYFSELAAFSKFFKKYTNLSPSEYRKIVE